jgi:hypothetical protein
MSPNSMRNRNRSRNKERNEAGRRNYSFIWRSDQLGVGNESIELDVHLKSLTVIGLRTRNDEANS